ncbi:MAG: transcriptional regulator, TetR family [Bacteroidetes bacterium]|jgi:AcrR family transcriptional regulator|nr:transcriptional regulator, TetR family [Bacteroidota bacterium]MDF2452821.1 transcriptional regulator, TetR family [Bacteroidota bacterium]
MSERKEDILTAALELFNKKGIDEVRTRDIAKEIQISLGNLTYYFPTKNDIVFALVQEAGKAIEDALSQNSANPGKNILVTYFGQVETIFKTHLKYRFLFGRWGEIISSNPPIQKFAQDFLKVRFDSWKGLNEQLVKEKYARPALAEDSYGHSYIINILALFWHQEFSMYFPGLSDKQKIEKALAIFFQSYKPYLTKKGWDELEPLLKKLEHY